jgi:predicted transposase/invertase (TIGR01784 family)
VSILQFDRFHSKFHLAEDHTREVFVGDIEFHILELQKLHLATADRQARLDRWARFLRAETTEELEALAAEHAIMNTAKLTLEELSLDPEAQRLARERETSVLMHQHLVASAVEAAEPRGKAEGLRVAIRSVCAVVGVDLGPAKLGQLAKLDVKQLTALLDVLETERHWPEMP